MNHGAHFGMPNGTSHVCAFAPALGGAILLALACVLVSGSAGRAQSNGGGGSSGGGQGHPSYSSNQTLNPLSEDDQDP